VFSAVPECVFRYGQAIECARDWLRRKPTDWVGGTLWCGGAGRDRPGDTGPCRLSPQQP